MELNVKNYSNDYHEFALQIFEDLKKSIGTEVSLEHRTVYKGWDDDERNKGNLKNSTREFVDIKVKSDYPLSIDLKYAFDEHLAGKDPIVVLEKAFNDIGVEMTSERRIHNVIHSNDVFEKECNNEYSVEQDEFEL